MVRTKPSVTIEIAKNLLGVVSRREVLSLEENLRLTLISRCLRSLGRVEFHIMVRQYRRCYLTLEIVDMKHLLY